jgi:FlaA1/EpsC-like NDP-sugar epimerase
LSGLEIKDDAHPEGEIAISYTGLRPGEKLYEELLIGDNVSDTCHPRIMRAEELIIPWEELEKRLDSLAKATTNDDHEQVRSILMQSVSGFAPQCKISDLLWQQGHVATKTAHTNP